MTNTNIEIYEEDEVIEAEVSSELEEAKVFAKTLSSDDVKSGQWFVALLQKVIQSYDRNARSEYFQQKYPGLAPDEIADKLISVTVKYATIAGGVTGATASAGQISSLISGGMSLTLMVGSIGAEMLYLAKIQMRLVLDLANVYDLQLNADDPEDILMIFGYALGIAPTELIGQGVQVATKAGTPRVIKKYITKGSLKSVQSVSQKLIGKKILQRTIIKFVTPLASVVVGSSYNYVITKSVGAIAKAHLKNRGQVTDELRQLVSRQNTYIIAFPAAAMYMAQVDGEFSAKEKDFYRALLSRMSFEEHTQTEFQKVVASEENILDAIAEIEDEEVKSSLIEVMVLMAVYDGKLAKEEREFLITTADYLNVPLDISEVEARTTDYRIIAEEKFFIKAAGAAKEAASSATNKAGQAAGNVKNAATMAGGKVTTTFGKVFRQKKAEAQNMEKSCPSCENSVPGEYKFCPSCGHSMATEKECVSCKEVIPIDFGFCPHCGTSQE